MVLIKEFSRKTVVKKNPEDKEAKMKQMRKEHEKLIKGRFEFVDAQGGFLEFAYRWFKGDPLLTYKLFHGEITELPQGVVRHLNNTKKKVRKILANMDPNSRGVSSTFEIQSRVNFIPCESV